MYFILGSRSVSHSSSLKTKKVPLSTQFLTKMKKVQKNKVRKGSRRHDTEETFEKPEEV